MPLAVAADGHDDSRREVQVSWLQAAVLGIIQGLTEFLPVSSTAHVRILPAVVGWSDPGAAFSAITQLGSLLAVVLYFASDIARVAWTWLRSLWTPGLRSDPDARLGWYIIIGTIPLGVFGLIFADYVETAARNLWLIAGALIGFGLLLWVADRVTTQRRGLTNLRLRDGIVVGLFQALALIPGTSRAGATITGGLLLNLTREAATRYSFLLSIPAVLLAGLFELRQLGETGVPAIAPTAVATVVAFVVAYATVAWMLRFVARHSMMLFIVWRFALGGLIIALLAVGML